MTGKNNKSKTLIKRNKERLREWAILRALFKDGIYDLETCAIIMERDETYLRVLINEFAEINPEDLL